MCIAPRATNIQLYFVYSTLTHWHDVEEQAISWLVRELGGHITHLPMSTACGCSIGSASEECDQVTGACQCLDGAIGDKCDGCGPEYEGGHASST